MSITQTQFKYTNLTTMSHMHDSLLRASFTFFFLAFRLFLFAMRNSRERNIYFIFTFYYYHHQCNFLSSPVLRSIFSFGLLALSTKWGCERKFTKSNNNKCNHNSHPKIRYMYVTLWNVILPFPSTTCLFAIYSLTTFFFFRWDR